MACLRGGTWIEAAVQDPSVVSQRGSFIRSQPKMVGSLP